MSIRPLATLTSFLFHQLEKTGDIEYIMWRSYCDNPIRPAASRVMLFMITHGLVLGLHAPPMIRRYMSHTLGCLQRLDADSGTVSIRQNAPSPACLSCSITSHRKLKAWLISESLFFHTKPLFDTFEYFFLYAS